MKETSEKTNQKRQVRKKPIKKDKPSPVKKDEKPKAPAPKVKSMPARAAKIQQKITLISDPSNKEKTARVEIKKEKAQKSVEDLIKEEDNKGANSTDKEFILAQENSFIPEKSVKEELSSIRETAEFESEMAANRKNDEKIQLTCRIVDQVTRSLLIPTDVRKSRTAQIFRQARISSLTEKIPQIKKLASDLESCTKNILEKRKPLVKRRMTQLQECLEQYLSSNEGVKDCFTQIKTILNVLEKSPSICEVKSKQIVQKVTKAQNQQIKVIKMPSQSLTYVPVVRSPPRGSVHSAASQRKRIAPRSPSGVHFPLRPNSYAVSPERPLSSKNVKTKDLTRHKVVITYEMIPINSGGTPQINSHKEVRCTNQIEFTREGTAKLGIVDQKCVEFLRSLP